MARRRTVMRGGVARRESSWFFFPVAQTALTATGGTLISTFNAAALALRPFTIVRSHFLVAIESDQIAASEIAVGGFGACVVIEQATAVGVTAVPTPITDSGSDEFFIHQFMTQSFTLLDATGFISNANREYHIDSKAMRKVSESQDIAITGEFSSVGSGFTILTMGRMLVKLH